MSQESNRTRPQENQRLLTEFAPHTYTEWREAVDKLLKGKPYEKIMLTHTYEGITLDPMYRREDGERLAHIRDLPGSGSYVRGTKPEGARVAGWTVAQEITEPTPAMLNTTLLHDLNRGQTGVNIVLDAASRMGLDPDMAPRGSVGKDGVSLATVQDMQTLLDGIMQEYIDVTIQAYDLALPYTAMVAAAARKKGLKLETLTGTIGADPLGTLAEEGTLGCSLNQAYDEMYTLTAWGAENAPKLRTIAVHAHVYHNGGGSAVEELAFAFGTAVCYIDALLERGLDINTIASRIRFDLSLGSNFFMEIAKLRAARMLWKHIVQAYGGNEDAQKMFIHARTSTYNKTIYDPYVNMLRTTTEAFSGVIGSADSMHVGAFDEVFRVPNEFSRRIARNQQIILREETHLDAVIDPAGGSWYIESLTAKLCDVVWKNFQITQEAGGFWKMLQSGAAQKAVATVAKARTAAVSTRKDVIVGTNMYANMTEQPLEPRQWDYDAIQKQRAAMVVRNDALNLDFAQLCMDDVISACEAGATLGQIVEALRGTEAVTGIEPVPQKRRSEIFEKLRRAVEAADKRPTVFLANNGPVLQYKARADFSREFFEVAGFSVVENGGYGTAEAAADAALASGADVTVICSTDATYPRLVPTICQRIKAAKPQMTIVLAGYPKTHLAEFTAAGVDEYIHVRANAFTILTGIAAKAGVTL